MLAKADGITRAGWALADPETGNLLLGHISESEEDAHALRRGFQAHMQHMPLPDVVPVFITIEAVIQ